MSDSGTHSSRRINALIQQLGYNNYLEIGVHKGATFLSVLAERKVAVDPHFMFDYLSHQSSTTKFFQMTSDEYFARHAEHECFDLFFLDGLHTFEQTFRDFCCSLSCAHADSVFLIDDTVPNDVYSALPDETDTRRFRSETGSSNTAWHGDVFKIVFAVHDFFQNLSYCTINTGGNPQTLVWRRQRHEFNPKFSSLEAISRLSYFDFRKNLNIMRMCDESSGIETLISSLKRPHPS